MDSIESDLENSDKIYLCKTSSMNKQLSNIIYMLDCQHIRLKGTSAPPSQTKYSIACVHITFSKNMYIWHMVQHGGAYST